MIMPVIFPSKADGGGGVPVFYVQTYIVVDAGGLQYNLFLMNSDGYGSSEYKVLLAKRYFYTSFMCVISFNAHREKS